MAQLQWGRNFIVAETRYCDKWVPLLEMGFNGAATLSLRKLAEMHQDLRGQSKLQWGRNFIVAETRYSHDCYGDDCKASMGPQLYRCGNSNLRHTLAVLLTWLQWGRNFIVAETSWSLFCHIIGIRLQWGRNFIVAETHTGLPRQRPIGHASMGPQLYRCGNGTLGPIIDSDYD